MAPKRNFRPSGARATLIAFIAVVSVVALMTTTVSAQCDCTEGYVYLSGAYCYPNWYSSSLYYSMPVTSSTYSIYCQREGPCIGGNCWWDQIYYEGSYCYVSDYYMKTGCANRCSSRPLC